MTPRALRGRDALFIDTNLLLLLIVGWLDVEQVERFRRTRAYTRDDFALLNTFVAGFARFLTTPNVMTEVSNLAGQLSEPLRREAWLTLGRLTGRFEERVRASKEIVGDPAFPILGLTDTSVILAADSGVTVLTDDLHLYVRLSSAGVEAINFNHLRTGSWT